MARELNDSECVNLTIFGIVCLMAAVACFCNYQAESTYRKAFELGYEQVQLTGTTQLRWAPTHFAPKK